MLTLSLKPDQTKMVGIWAIFICGSLEQLLQNLKQSAVYPASMQQTPEPEVGEDAVTCMKRQLN